jgi:hypothetical protein
MFLDIGGMLRLLYVFFRKTLGLAVETILAVKVGRLCLV